MQYFRVSNKQEAEDESSHTINSLPISDENQEQQQDLAKNSWISQRWKHIGIIGTILILFALIVTLTSIKLYRILNHENVEIALFGDSLIENTDFSFHIAANIQHALSPKYPSLEFSVYSSGQGGNTIFDLRNRMDRDVLQRHSTKWLISGRSAPNAVVVYWDSDCSDYTETMDMKDSMRNTYKENLYFVLKELMAHIPCVILAGPSLLGELPHGQNSKDDMYDDYVSINRNISSDLDIQYLNTRKAFFDNLPSDWQNSLGYLTIDGEHHNAKGAQIVQDMFIDALTKCIP